jgi:hypothetical protein
MNIINCKNLQFNSNGIYIFLNLNNYFYNSYIVYYIRVMNNNQPMMSRRM